MARPDTDKQLENRDGLQRKLANLRPWPKGVSGNPKGRPKSRTLSEAYRRALFLPVPNDPEGRTYADLVAEMLAKEAAKGNVAAAKELADRTEGKARQSLDVLVTGGKRDLYEQAIELLISHSEEVGEPISRATAIARLSAFVPDLAEEVR